jgi:hypothetical protein
VLDKPPGFTRRNIPRRTGSAIVIRDKSIVEPVPLARQTQKNCHAFLRPATDARTIPAPAHRAEISAAKDTSNSVGIPYNLDPRSPEIAMISAGPDPSTILAYYSEAK